MANSPETHLDFKGGETRHPSIDSMVEISLPFIEADLQELDDRRDLQLALRFADLRVLNRQTPTILAPGFDKGAHPMLLTESYTGPGFNGYHDVRRVIITHENRYQEVTARDWLVNMTIGACWSFESHRDKTGAPTAASGPLIDVNYKKGVVTLSEGLGYQADFEALVPTITSEDTDEFSDFMAETHPFIEGYRTHLDMHNPNAFKHVRYPLTTS